MAIAFNFRTVALAAFALLLGAAGFHAQSPAAQPMRFDVVSIKLNKTSAPSHSNVPLNPTAAYSPTGGLFSATDFRLQSYLAWAYDLPGYAAARMFSQYPQWALADRFDIEAKALGNPTKAQMQMMMQSLLADRFKLVVHRVTKQGSVFELVQSKPGKAGPQLWRHTTESCSAASAPPEAVAGVANAAVCGGGVTFLPPAVPGRVRYGARGATMKELSDMIPAWGAEVDRPVLDRTGLSGAFDFVVEFAPAVPAAATPDTAAEEPGQTLLEALQGQLGLRLKSATGPVETLIIDHVEEPTPN